MFIFKCEICQKQRTSKLSITRACKPCLTATDREWEKGQEKKEKEWRAKHKCRTCKSGLPLSRYFYCARCWENMMRPTMSAFQGERYNGRNQRA